MNKKFLFIVLIIIALTANIKLLGQTNDSIVTIIEEDTNIVIKADLPIMMMLDSLANLNYFEYTDKKVSKGLCNKYNFNENEVPQYSDSVYAARIELLNKKSPFNLVYYKDVKAFIELYTVRKRDLSERILGLAELYFPYFETMLDRFNLPLELKYLAVVESSLNPTAKSRVGATGIWQFMYPTGKQYDLNVSSYIDERCDPYKSTIAACRYFSHLYSIYNDWYLVLAAYNYGTGNVNKAIRRAGGTGDFWRIARQIPAETRSYIPAFIAVNYLMNYHQEHNLYPNLPKNLYANIDTVVLKDRVSFTQISETIGVSIDDLKYLNPSYKQGIVPVDDKKLYSLVLPKEFIGSFINNEQLIYNYKKEELQIVAEPEIITKYHRVKKGQTLSYVAKQYKCSVNDIKQWNKLRSTNLKIGQNLIVSYEEKTKQIEASTTTIEEKQEDKIISNENHINNSLETIEEIQKKPKYHKVSKGQTLFLLSKQYQCSVNDIKKWNNLNSGNLRIGQNLIIGYEEKLIVKQIQKSIDTVQKQLITNNEHDSLEQNIKKIKIKENISLKNFCKANNFNIQEIKKLNNLQQDTLFANTQIIIGYTKTTKTKEDNYSTFYTVQKGDTIQDIAAKANIPVEKILKINNIKNPEEELTPGQKIRIN